MNTPPIGRISTYQYCVKKPALKALEAGDDIARFSSHWRNKRRYTYDKSKPITIDAMRGYAKIGAISTQRQSVDAFLFRQQAGEAGHQRLRNRRHFVVARKNGRAVALLSA